ncbi:MAG: hypothetical protein RMJ35_02340, partial [Phycisphaerales bacterium]|nr:hypothetical protein [Phycisphaerales bacterium]
LIELLVVIGLLAILLAMLLPVIRQTRAQADASGCASNLRQLYLAQMFYADENGGRLAAPMGISSIGRWDTKLEKYLNRNSIETAVTVAALACPSVHTDQLVAGQLTYGVNSHLHMPNWQSRRSARHNASEIILMGDMPPATLDQLVTEDRYFLDISSGSPIWLEAVNHRSDRSYRHARQTRANMLMSDGHVRAFSPAELFRDKGHWYWGSDFPIDVGEYMGSCCD